MAEHQKRMVELNESESFTGLKMEEVCEALHKYVFRSFTWEGVISRAGLKKAIESAKALKINLMHGAWPVGT